MRFVCGKVIVTDLKRSTAFYEDVLMQDTVLKEDSFVVFSSGVMLYSLDAWKDCILVAETEVRFGNHDVVIAFEENDFDSFMQHLLDYKGVELVHNPIEKPDGLRVVRLYDPDHHVIEVNETRNINPDDILSSEMAFVDMKTCATTGVLSSCRPQIDIDHISENSLNNKKD